MSTGNLGSYSCALALAASVAGCTGVISSDGSPALTSWGDDVKTMPVERGVDRASVLSTHEAQILKQGHGVKWTGVYIGGACNGGSGWTRSRVEDIAHATAWTFMPIWVGQQASSICGAHDVTYARGHADGVAAAARMHAMGWGANKDIPVALDVEAPTYFDHVASSTRYVRGWVQAVRAAGYRPYVYGSPFALNHYHDAGVRIDAAWAASYFYSGFEDVAPGHLDQMGSRYRHRDRGWQYAGNFEVSGVGRVDANTSSFLLAPAPGGTNRATTAHRDVPEACGALQPGEGLARGEALESCDGATRLALTEGGEFELRAGGQLVWAGGIAGAGATVVLQDTGELVAFDDAGDQVWTSDSGGFPGAHVELGGAEGALAIVSDDDAPQTLWTSGGGLLVHEDWREDLTEVDAERE